MIAEGVVGPQPGKDGAQVRLRGSYDGALATMDAHARFQEAVSRGGVYTLSSALAGVTVAAANNSPLAAGTGQPLAGIFNPNGSGYNLVIWMGQIWTVSGTPGGPFGWNVIAANAGITAAGGNAAVNLLTLNTGGSIARTFSNTALTGSAAATMLRGLGGPAAVAAGAGNNAVTEFVDGSIIVPPGAFCGIASTAAGTTHVAGSAIVWEEVKL